MEQIAVLVFEMGEPSAWAHPAKTGPKKRKALEDLTKIGDRKGVRDRCSNR